MREPRNPFRLRAAENIESDVTFLQLFGPGMLDVLPPKEQLWGKVHIFQSAPGGGKTSLLRLFTPNALLNLHSLRANADYKELFQRMVDLGAMSEDGPKLLGVMLSCARNYAALADMPFDKTRKERVLFSLLNSRIALATLRNALAFRKYRFPEDLSRVTIDLRPNSGLLPGLLLPCSGQQLYEWALNLEVSVCDAIDSLNPAPAELLPGHDALDAIGLLTPEGILIDSHPIAERTLLMLDDVHKLSPSQREKILETVIDTRSPTSIWMAERFEALSTDELLSSGSSKGRDYQGVIELEKTLRKQFEKLALNIADRRSQAAAETEISSFKACLKDSLDGVEWQKRIEQILSQLISKVTEHARARPIFGDWIKARHQMEGTPFEKVVAWRILDILIQRELGRNQTTFDFDLAVEALEDKDDSSVKAAAMLFVAKEYSLPYYYGHGKLAALASSNIEQYLSIAENEFEEIVSAALLKRDTYLTPEIQHEIVLQRANERWDELPRQVRNGREVRKFLEAVGSFANWATYQPSAPYGAGVTGIAISMADRDRLRDPKYLEKFPKHAKLASTIASLIAHNLLEPTLDARAKNVNWMVLNLNRILCPKFSLPLQYGGWREKTLDELCRWADVGFSAPKGKDKASSWS